METMTVTLNPEHSAFVKHVVSAGEYNSAEEFMADLVAKARKKRWEAHLERLLEEGLASEAIEMTPAVWADIRQRFSERHPNSDRP